MYKCWISRDNKSYTSLSFTEKGVQDVNSFTHDPHVMGHLMSQQMAQYVGNVRLLLQLKRSWGP